MNGRIFSYSSNFLCESGQNWDLMDFLLSQNCCFSTQEVNISKMGDSAFKINYFLLPFEEQKPVWNVLNGCCIDSSSCISK
jgi:hypothetical protein